MWCDSDLVEPTFERWLPLCSPVVSLHQSDPLIFFLQLILSLEILCSTTDTKGAFSSNSRQWQNTPNSVGFSPALPPFPGLSLVSSDRSSVPYAGRTTYQPFVSSSSFSCSPMPQCHTSHPESLKHPKCKAFHNCHTPCLRKKVTFSCLSSGWAPWHSTRKRQQNCTRFLLASSSTPFFRFVSLIDTPAFRYR